METDNKTPESCRLTLPKSCRLRHRTLVDNLFACGTSLYQYPLRLSFRTLSEEELRGSFRHSVPDRIGPVQFLITVPKKKLRHAVDRVLMRRRIREALRLRMPVLRKFVADNPEVRTMSLAVIYLDKNLSSSARIADKIDRIIARLTPALLRNSGSPVSNPQNENDAPQTAD